jgi:hypothetical protein
LKKHANFVLRYYVMKLYMAVKLPLALKIRTNFALFSALEERRRGGIVFNCLNRQYTVTSMYFWSSEMGASNRLLFRPEIPAFVMTTSRATMLCVIFDVLITVL